MFNIVQDLYNAIIKAMETKVNYQNLISKIPKEVSYACLPVRQVTETLKKAGFSAYLVGGCVRDLIMVREPKDWDITTNAKPEEIIALFEKTVYENTFGTVGVCIPVKHLPVRSEAKEGETTPSIILPLSKGEMHKDLSLAEGVVNHETEYMIIEVTPYRIEAKYSDNRHPDEVMFTMKLEDDLKRRDFTINALAMTDTGEITDIFGGIKDIKDKVLRTVGEPDERFGEDALRMLRAIRLSCQLDFAVSYEVINSITKNAHLIKNISQERIRDEFVKIILSKNPAMGIGMLQKFGLLKYIIPELEEGINCEQGGAHKFDVFEHLVQALQHSADKNWSLTIRLSALFHDIGKPRTRRAGEKKAYTFYGHEVVGARMAKKIMERMKFPREEINFVESMVKNHMFFSDTEQITLSAVRRIIVKVSSSAKATADEGKNEGHPIWDLMKVRECDRVGMAKKEAPYRLRKYHAMIEECLRDPISVSQLKIDGNFLMKDMNIKPGPRMGWILNALLEEVLENPEKNEIEYLKNRVGELEQLSDTDLRALGEKAKEKKEELEDIEVGKLHEKHGVRAGKGK